MADKWMLKRTKQCAKCPWRKDVDPNDIPDGYSQVKHCALKSTIATDPLESLRHNKAMACHESSPDEEMHCIGWLMNQLGPGNNIAMRIRMMSCGNADKIKLVGEQHDHFEDTLPGPARVLLSIENAEENGYDLFGEMGDEEIAIDLCSYDSHFEQFEVDVVTQWVTKARELRDAESAAS